jgi:cell division transport system permease protein
MEVVKAAVIARASPGIAEVRPYSKEEAARLLEPWLGSGLQIDDLPVPRLIVARIAPDATPDLAQLRQTLGEQIPGVSLDDHRSFLDRMRGMSRAVVVLGIGVLLLVFVATVLSVAFATRAAIATNRPVIEVLHLIGAKDSFIARHFQQHFLQLGLKGGLIGAGCAMALFAVAELTSSWFIGASAGEQFAALFATSSIGAPGYLAMLAQAGVIAGVTAATSRHTVKRTIETIH